MKIFCKCVVEGREVKSNKFKRLIQRSKNIYMTGCLYIHTHSRMEYSFVFDLSTE